jgi:chromosome segregation ATPase
MDKVNRKISMAMVIDSLRKRGNSQSIFITPQDMEIDDKISGPDVRIRKLPDPVRNRT